MRARDRRFGTSSTKTRVGIATAALAGGAVAIAAVLAGGHGAGTAATSAAYSSRAGNEGSVLSSAMTSWNGSRQSSYAQLSQLTRARQFSQAKHKGKMLAIQRGIVVLATKKFLILQSSNGSLHLWLLSGRTIFQNVSNSIADTQALTASTSTAFCPARRSCIRIGLWPRISTGRQRVFSESLRIWSTDCHLTTCGEESSADDRSEPPGRVRSRVV